MARRLPGRVAIFGLLALAGAIGIAGCDRFAKSAPPSIATALGVAKDDLELPEAKKVDAEPADSGGHIVVSRTRLSVLGDPWTIAKIPADPALGLAAEDKRNGRNSIPITPLVQAVEWQSKAAGGLAAHGTEQPVWVVVADTKTTYRVACEVVVSAAEGGAWKIAFAAQNGDRAKPVGILALTLVGGSERGRRDPLTVRFGEAGAAISTKKRTVGAGCKDVGPGPAVAREPNRPFDFGALESCLKEVRKQDPELAREILQVGAEPATDLGTVIKVIDAARSAGFEHFNLAAPTAPEPPAGGASP